MTPFCWWLVQFWSSGLFELHFLACLGYFIFFFLQSHKNCINFVLVPGPNVLLVSENEGDIFVWFEQIIAPLCVCSWAISRLRLNFSYVFYYFSSMLSSPDSLSQVIFFCAVSFFLGFHWPVRDSLDACPLLCRVWGHVRQWHSLSLGLESRISKFFNFNSEFFFVLFLRETSQNKESK